jgi:glycosyltransferase involved in cell wall biosynthesis
MPEQGLPAPQLAFSVIVPATDPRSTLPRCAAAIRTALAPADELIVVTEAPLRGAASARNTGAAEAENEVLVFVDADVEISSDALDRLRRRFSDQPELVAVFGSYDDDPEERDVVSTFRNLLHHHVHHGSAGSVDSFWSGLGAVRRAAFEAVGGFDVAIPTSIEDIEFGARLHANAGRIELDPTVQGKHLKRWSLVSMVRTDLRLRGVPWVRLALRGRATTNELNLAWRHRVSAASCVVMVASVIRKRPGTAAASLGVLGALNYRFYRLLARRGPRYLVSGVCLHVLHHLTSAAALVLGLLSAGRRGTSR